MPAVRRLLDQSFDRIAQEFVGFKSGGTAMRETFMETDAERGANVGLFPVAGVGNAWGVPNGRPRVLSFGGACLALILCVAFLAESGFAVTRFVWTNSPSPGSGYLTWQSAATNIQDAVNAASSGDLILVTNGVYAEGSSFAGDMATRVAIAKAVTVRSVNGPVVTVIQGQGPMGAGAVRCVYLAAGAALEGFTMTNGTTLTSFSGSSGVGGGVCCGYSSTELSISNCVITGNSAYYLGGGAYFGTLRNCTLSQNSMGSSIGGGGGAYGCTLYGCKLTGNVADSGGGVAQGNLYGCLLTGNTAKSAGGGCNGGTLYDCVLSSNRTSSSGGGSCNSTLFRCRVIGNTATTNGWGGGAYGGTLYSCAVSGNAAALGGGGVASSTLYGCTVTGNRVLKVFEAAANGGAACFGGGAYKSTLYNCVLYYNTTATPDGANYDDISTMSYCCTWPLPSGVGNFTNAPGISAFDNPHLLPGSACIDAGWNTYGGIATDVDGDARTNGPAVDVGCDEFWAASATGALAVAIAVSPSTNTVVGFPLSFQATIEGRPSTVRWQFGDGTVVTNQNPVSHGYAGVGSYAVVVQAANLSGAVMSTTGVQVVTLAAATRYVATNGNDAADGLSWAAAKASLQSAVSAIPVAGGLVWVSNGVYRTGGAFAAGSTSRVAVTLPVTLRSVNGPSSTFIAGAGPLGSNAVRCAYLCEGSAMSGFTLTNGFTPSDGLGGGIYCGARSVVVSNCVLTGNTAGRHGGGSANGTFVNCAFTGNMADMYASSASFGGGAYCGDLYNCTLALNFAGEGGGGAARGSLRTCLIDGNGARQGAGAYNATLSNCTLINNYADWGGGAATCTLYSCTIRTNSAYWTGGGTTKCAVYDSTLTGNLSGAGGGADGGVLRNCYLAGNTARLGGGGASQATLYGCTVIGNHVTQRWNQISGDTCSGGGAYNSTLYNSIVYYNEAGEGANQDDSCTATYSCTWPLAAGVGNFTNEPGLSALNNPHLLPESVCIDAGCNAYAETATDVDGEVRINGASVDVGCDEVWAVATTGALSVAIAVTPSTNVAVGYPLSFQASVQGRPLGVLWQFGDGMVVTNQNPVSHAYASAGPFSVMVRVTNLTGSAVSTTNVHVVSLTAATRYVTAQGSDAADGLSWSTAKSTLQAAVSAMPVAGGLVLVSNGVYRTGGTGNRRVALTNAVTVRSMNGPAVTSIEGEGPLGNTNAVGCAYVADGSLLAGFTLTNGISLPGGYGISVGGAVFCDSAAGMVSNCLLINGIADTHGGGAYLGTLVKCELVGNLSYEGGGAYIATLHDCIVSRNVSVGPGAGASHSLLLGCMLTGNVANASSGGGASYSTLYDCALVGNVASNGGGADSSFLFQCEVSRNSAWYAAGALACSLYSCTIVSNTAQASGGGIGAGNAYNCTIAGNTALTSGGGIVFNSWNPGGIFRNCIVVSNTAPSLANYTGGSFANCCTWPMPSAGTGNITNNPLFINYAGGNLHLSPGSRCVNAGDNAYAMVTKDCDDKPRLVDGTVDMGAFECQDLTTPAMAVTPATRSFGTVTVNATSQLVFTVQNTGAGSLTGTVGGVSAPFSLVGGTAYTLAGGATTNVILRFAPTMSGTYSNTASFNSNAGNQLRTVTGIAVFGAGDLATNNVPKWWLVQYGLTNFNTDAMRDVDHDGMLTWQEWVAGCDPTNINSVFRFTSADRASGQGMVIRWPSISNRFYSLMRSTNLVFGANGFFTLPGASNMPATPAINCYTDAVQGVGPYFYRINVRE